MTTPLRQALLDFSAGRTEQARRSCLDLLTHDPDDPGALHLLGLITHRKGAHAQAAVLLRRAAESPLTTTWYLLSYAELCCKDVDRAGAITAIRRAIALGDSLALPWFCLGKLLLEDRELVESGHAFEQTLRCDPRFWQARANLALVNARRGDPGNAHAEFHHLIREQPHNAELYGLHAAFLQELGQLEQALGQARLAARFEPEILEYRLLAADIELQLGHYAAALAGLEGLGNDSSPDPALTALRAHLLRHLDRNDDAVALCRASVEYGVESAELLRAYALAQHLVGHEEEALSLFDRAVAAAANAPLSAARALSDKAVLLQQLGRAADAATTFDLAVQREPSLAEAHYNRANAKLHTADDPAIAAMQALLQGPASYRDRILLHFALGKAHYEAANVERAFPHWHEANRLQRASIDYNPAATTARMIAIARRALGEVDAAAAHGAQVSEVPVFIVGMPRCGSTLVEHILASHPDIHGGGELLQLRGLFEAAAPAGAAAMPGTGVVRGSSDTRLASAALERLQRAATKAKRNTAALRIIDKDLFNFLHLGVIHRVFPRARIIHCRRDALDTCFSTYTKLFQGSLDFAYEMGELGRYFRGYHALMAHWRAALPQQIFLDLDYEKLVRAPYIETARLLDFLGVPWHDACLRFFDTPRMVGTASSTQVRRPIYRTSVQRTRPIRAHLTPLIDALGDLAADPSPPRTTR
jgi:Flp pilus assembly protein TadD